MHLASAPSDAAQAATFAAWPPTTVLVRARTSSPRWSGCSSRATTSSNTSPRVAIRIGQNRIMDEDHRLDRARTFLIGSVVGASAALATARRRREIARRRRHRRLHPAGLAAFEGAPCYRELLAEEAERGDR
jgi:hypothetical protein